MIRRDERFTLKQLLDENHFKNEDLPLSIFQKDNGDVGTFFKNTINVDENSASYLDMYYEFAHSGLKRISFLLESEFADITTEMPEYSTAAQTFRAYLINTVKFKYLDKWKKLYETLNLEYNPIKPYDIKTTENKNGNETFTSKKTDEISKTDKNNGTRKDILDVTDDVTSTSNIKETGTTDDTRDGTDANNVFGYNSNEATNYDENINYEKRNSKLENSTDNTSNDNRIRNDTRNVTLTDDNVHTENNSQNRNDTTTKEDINTTTRVGNIGNTTIQELITQERELLNWQFWDVVFDDLDRIYTSGMF